MRYIKKFNESIVDVDNFTEYCKDNLAFLMDVGFKISVTSDEEAIRISLDANLSGEFSDWCDIKDDIIPFIELLEDKYKLDNVFIRSNNGYVRLYLMADIVSDDLEREDIYRVVIVLKKK